jgi:hypothetical protein
MLQRSFCWILLSTTAVGCAGLFRGSFSNRLWRPLRCVYVCTRYTCAQRSYFVNRIHSCRDEQPVASRALTFIVALALPNIQELRETLDAVSNPKSSRYGQYLSLEQVQEQFGPSTGIGLVCVSFASVNSHDTIALLLAEALAETVQWLRSCLPFANVDVSCLSFASLTELSSRSR